ncbi:MAG: bifunctional [glutamine synthetase] adenylyltransferase/[glutamine synthetase]-adenylyl-L-tyrosine phosphorylase, partial [Rhodospirillales bacterium]|nr:bifunctional [glutamine synthetase] adenylyltransferase/[glutamine synthetase]-adenylyl-L-tyrosine phosphorylase [Rhodospirillales bacterium]
MHDLFPEFRQASFPAPSSPDLRDLGQTQWIEAVHKLDNSQLSSVVESLTGDKDAQNVLAAVFGNSPYLSQTCISDPAILIEVLQQGPDSAASNVFSRLDMFDTGLGDAQSVSRHLRVTKSQMALIIAIADMGNLWPLAKITQCLSDLAQKTLSKACSHVLQQAAAKGVITLKHPDDPEKESGYVVLGMGKLGSFELNYSSDIDLIVVFDPDLMQCSDPVQLQKHCIRMTRDLARIMDERTADGYVFRTDLRLRPDPGATPLAVSMRAAETYYESQGQNWERAAMIKARPVAGDLEAGAAFVKWLRPFVWRKNLDFAAIQDIHSIKRQINARRGGSTVATLGHNIKLGRGGIREIEFFAQTQQLIWGGRITELRSPATISALNALVTCGQVARDTADDLIAAYEFLRRTEHRLQMINDEQTQTLPQDTAGMEKLAIFMGFDSRAPFVGALMEHLKRVEDHYARLFEDAPALSADGAVSGNLVFTGSDSDPDTLETITKYGFLNPETVDAAIRGWHHGRYRAMRSTRAREMLTELTPTLLSALGETPDPDAAFVKFDEFLAGLPSGVQLFSMLYSNPQILTLLANILGEAPRLAELLSNRPSLFDGVLTADFFDPPPKLNQLRRALEKHLQNSDHFENALDTSRRWVNDQKFQIGLQSLNGLLSPPDASWALSNTAESALLELLPIVEQEFATKYGRIEGAQFCTIAFGKLGGHEMTPTSDLDLVFIYETPDEDTLSDGDKGLPPTQYFARLGQRFINAINAPTAEGILYEVDMRLRPSGNAGPIACTLDTFVQYHKENAWTWERLALTKARAVAGDAALGSAVDHVIRDILTTPLNTGTGTGTG